MHGDRERALAAGCNGFIAKPIDEETFASRSVSGFLTAPALRPGPSPRCDRHGERARRASSSSTTSPTSAALLRGGPGGRRPRRRRGARPRPRPQKLVEDEPFELAIIDVMLGGGSGYSLTETLTSMSLGLPARPPRDRPGRSTASAGSHAGADDFIGKPIETVELRARARSLIRVGRAIREQRRVGRERSEAYRKLEELDRLKSGFLSTVSHELRTPLNTIILLAHQLEKVPASAEDSERQARDVRFLREAAEVAPADDQQHPRPRQARRRPARPASPGGRRSRTLLRESANLLEPQAREKGLEVEPSRRDPDLPPTVCLDRGKVSRVLVNLLVERRQVHGSRPRRARGRGRGRAR